MIEPFSIGSFHYDPSQTYIMGIVNITPDSFSDGGKWTTPDAALRHTEQLIREGAHIIDVGAESTRPGAPDVPAEEEEKRLLPYLKKYRQYFDTPLSLDTTKATIAEMGLSLGVSIINDVSGLSRDQKMADVAAAYNCPVILMHMKGTPRTMQRNPEYEDVIKEVKSDLEKKIGDARKKGVSKIMIDPGIGFGKTVAHNLEILNRLKEFRSLNCPIAVGTSRKSFIGAITGAETQDRLPGTIASTLIAVQHGASIVRVHDVKEVKQALTVADAILRR